MNWLSIVKLFSGPLGNLINTGIASGAGALVAYSVSKGLPLDAAQNIVGGLVLAASAAINAATGTQIVQIQNIRETQGNGVTVVKTLDARKAGIPSVDAPTGYNSNAS